MSLGADIGNILGQYGSGNARSDRVEQDFDDVAQHASREDLQHGLSETFRSDQTPPFGNMVGQLFGQADTQQRAGMLNQLISAAGPAVLSALLGGSNRTGGLGGMSGMGNAGGMGGLGGLGGMLGGGAAAGGLGALLERLASGGQAQLSPEEAAQLRPEEVEALASEAEKNNPGVIDQMSSFYAQNPTLVKALGGAALAVALGKMANRNR